MQLEFSSRAEQDLMGILDYLDQASGQETAFNYGRKLREKCLEICSAPGMGTPHSIYRRIRKVAIGSHKIFYRAEQERIVIHRIWDARRGTEPKLRPPL